MKTSLIAASVLMFAFAANAETAAVPMIQILPVAGAVKTTPHPVAPASDNDAFAREQAAELDFTKGTNSATARVGLVAKTAQQNAAPQATAPAPQVAAPQSPAKPAPQQAATKPAPQAPAVVKPAQAAAPQTPAAVKPVVAKPASAPAQRAAFTSAHPAVRASVSPRANNAQLPSVNSLPRRSMDAASAIRERCQATGRRALKCMDVQIATLEAAIDTTETRLLNCREARKFDHLASPQTIDALVMSRFYKLRQDATVAFNEAATGESGRLEKAELDLRATLAWLNESDKFANRVCDSQQFAQMFRAELAAAK